MRLLLSIMPKEADVDHIHAQLLSFLSRKPPFGVLLVEIHRFDSEIQLTLELNEGDLLILDWFDPFCYRIEQLSDNEPLNLSFDF